MNLQLLSLGQKRSDQSYQQQAIDLFKTSRQAVRAARRSFDEKDFQMASDAAMRAIDCTLLSVLALARNRPIARHFFDVFLSMLAVPSHGVVDYHELLCQHRLRQKILELNDLRRYQTHPVYPYASHTYYCSNREVWGGEVAAWAVRTAEQLSEVTEQWLRAQVGQLIRQKAQEVMQQIPVSFANELLEESFYHQLQWWLAQRSIRSIHLEWFTLNEQPQVMLAFNVTFQPCDTQGWEPYVPASEPDWSSLLVRHANLELNGRAVVMEQTEFGELPTDYCSHDVPPDRSQTGMLCFAEQWFVSPLNFVIFELAERSPSILEQARAVRTVEEFGEAFALIDQL